MTSPPLFHCPENVFWWLCYTHSCLLSNSCFLPIGQGQTIRHLWNTNICLTTFWLTPCVFASVWYCDSTRSQLPPSVRGVLLLLRMDGSLLQRDVSGRLLRQWLQGVVCLCQRSRLWRHHRSVCVCTRIYGERRTGPDLVCKHLNWIELNYY